MLLKFGLDLAANPQLATIRPADQVIFPELNGTSDEIVPCHALDLKCELGAWIVFLADTHCLTNFLACAKISHISTRLNVTP